VSKPLLISKHPDRANIITAIADGTSERDIADKFKISRKAIHAYKVSIGYQNSHIQRQCTDKEALLQRLESWLEKVQKVVNACDEYLADSSGKYDLGPRDHDVEVIYDDQVEVEEGKYRTERKRAMLSQLLDKTGKRVIGTRYKIADPRELILKAVVTGKQQLELLGNIIGAIKQGETNINYNTQVNVIDLMPLVVEELNKSEAGKAILGNIQTRLLSAYKADN
jgi:hypothetical protein